MQMLRGLLDKLYSDAVRPIFLLGGLLGLVTITACGQEPPIRQPNVLFLLADDQRADTIHAWGNPDIETPNIDQLVAEGYSFRSNYNMGGNSGAVCMPSRAMIHSGLAYFRIPNDLSGTKTMPEQLREHGYTTFATGKWHNGQESWLRGFEKGKNIFFGGMSDHIQVPLFDLSADGVLVNERVGSGFSSEMFSAAAIEFLESHEGDKPFYAYVAFTAPHDPRQPPVAFREKYYASRPPLPANFLPQHPFNLGEWMTVRDEILAPWPRTEETIAEQLAEYYGMVTHLDEQVGKIMDALERSGYRDNTIVIYAADHGLAMGSHGLLGKQNVYEHSQKSPLIFVGPGIPNGESRSLTYLLDIFPTVASLLGISPPAELDGEDLSAIWNGETSEVRDSLFLAFTDVMRSVRDERYKLILYPQLGFTQLFDLAADADETTNLASNPSHETRIEDMTALLRKWQERLSDSQPLTVENPIPMDVDLSGIVREPDPWQPAWIVEKYFENAAR